MTKAIRTRRGVLQGGIVVLLASFWPGTLAAVQQTPDWLTLSAEMRVRAERRSGLGYRPDDVDGYGLLRTRINAEVQAGGSLRFFLQGQDARAPGIRPERAGGVFRDPFDIRQGYVQLGDPQESAMAVTLGRQLLVYGDQRLVGALDWTNTSRSFDALKVEVQGSKVEVDLFFASVVQNDPLRRLNRSDRARGFYGLWARLPDLAEGLVVEPFLLWRRVGVAAAEEGVEETTSTRRTVGARMVGSRGGLESSAMLVHQGGSHGAKDVDAWALSLAGRYAFDVAGSPSVHAEYNRASGDDDPDDGRVGWFDDLFPTAHLYYGYADLVGMRNILNYRLGSRVELWERLTLGVDLHAFRLESARDHLYNAGGAASVRTPESGAANVRVGEEIDVSFVLPLYDSVNLSGGIAHFFPGPFVEANSEGAPGTFLHTAIGWSF